MHSLLKAIGLIAATVVAVSVAIPVYIFVASEAVIERRYPLPAIGEAVAAEPNMIPRGAHLARVSGCSDCHAANLEGRRLRTDTGWILWSSNLRIAAVESSNGEFERALRRGLAPDATSLWHMPSAAYLYMSENDVVSLLDYLRSLGVAGERRPRPAWDLRDRFMLMEGRISPSLLDARDGAPSLDLGPRYDGGRYLARIACSECHATDLAGMRGVPDLNIVSLYDRARFFDLLRRGIGADGRHVAVMERLSSIRFRSFADYEIIALLDYLEARVHAPAELVARARANEARRRAQAAAEEQD